jgi:hypothetical protein
VPEPRLSDTVRDAAEASLRYYGRMGGLALELAEALVPSLSGLRPEVFRSPASPEPSAALAEAPRGQTIVIEAAAGRNGLGVFMVENTTGRKVSGPLGVSAFADESGREVQPTVRFSPEVVSLEPGDQVLVQVVAGVDGTFEPGVRYGAEIRIPELTAAGIPLVVRRRAARPRKA